MKLVTFGSIILGTGLLVPAPSLIAGPLTWTFSGVTFDDGGTASGSFTYDADTNTVSNIDIVTSADPSLGLPGTTYTQLFENSAGPVGFDVVAPADPEGMLFSFELASAMTDAGGVIALGTDPLDTPVTAVEQLCYNADCGLVDPQTNPYRESTLSLGGEISAPTEESATPEPGTLASLIGGLCLLPFRSGGRPRWRDVR